MAIAFDTAGNTPIPTTSTSATVDITAAATDAWCYCGIFIATTETGVTFTGWTQVLEGDQSTASHYAIFRRKKVAGDTTFTPSWPTSNKGVIVWASYTGLDGTTPDELAGFNQATSTSASTPSLTPNSNDRWGLAFFFNRSTTNGQGAISWTPGAGITERQDQNTTGGSSRFEGASVNDTNGAVTQAAHSYSATSTFGSNGGGILLFLIPGAGTTQVTLNDTGAGSDTAVVTVAASLAEAGAGVDTLTVGAAVPLADAGAGTDALTRAITQRNGFEGSNGTGITTGNSGGDGVALDVVGVAGSKTYDTSKSVTGSSSFHAAVSSGTAAVVEWTATFGSPVEYWGRDYFQISAAPMADARFFQQNSAADANQWGYTVTAAGKLALRDIPNALDKWTSTASPTTGVFHRIEWHATWDSGSNQVTVETSLFFGSNLHGTTPDETNSVSFAQSALPGTYYLGINKGTGGITWDTWHDEWALSSFGPLGPVSAPVSINLSDAGAASDAVRVTAAVPLVDSGSSTDTIAALAAVPLADTGTAADTLAVTAAVPLSDTGGATDSIVVQQIVPVPLSDVGAAADSLTVTVATTLAETGHASDQLTVTAAIPLADSGVASDSITVAQIVAKPLSDTGAAADSLTVTATVTLADLGAAAELLAATTLLGLADTGSAADTFTVQTVLPFTVGVLTTADVAMSVLTASDTAGDGVAATTAGLGAATDTSTATLTATTQAGGPS